MSSLSIYRDLHDLSNNNVREILCMLWGNPVIFTDCGENPMITIFPFEEYRVSLWFLQPFSIDIAGKTYRHPVNPCKHLQCSSRVHTWFLINLMFYSISQVIGLALTQSYSCQGSFSIIEQCLVQSRICSNV